jgi:hypothetical protein
MIGRLVRVTWHDAHGIEGWVSIHDIEQGPRVITSVGWALPGCKAGHIVLVGSVDEDMVDGGLAIPLGMVREVVELLDGARLPVEAVAH